MPSRKDGAEKPRQRNRAKEAFRENAERVRALVDSMPPRALRVRYLAPVAVALIGIAVSVLVWRLAASDESRAEAAEFERHAEHLVAAIDHELTENLEVLHSLEALYNVEDEVTRRKFQEFTQPAFARHADIQALEWIPRVRSSERAEYEQAAVRDGLDSFEFTERDGETLVTAAARDEYYPVYFVEPLRGNEAAVGFDLGSNPARLEALERARDSGDLVATRRIRLVQETESQAGFLVFQPIYEQGAPAGSVEQRRESLLGFALGVYRVGDIVGESLAGLETEAVEVRLVDQTSPDDPALLFSSVAGESIDETPAAMADQGGLQAAHSLDVAGRTWQVLFTPAPGYGSAAWAGSLLILFGGLAFTALASLFTAYSIWRAGKLQDAVEAQSRLGAMLEATPDFVGIADGEGHVVYVNRAGRLMVGVGPDEDLSSTKIPDYSPAWTNTLLQEEGIPTAIREGTWAGEAALLSREGREIPVSMVALSHKSPDGSVKYLSTISRDITERRRAEEERAREAAVNAGLASVSQALIEPRSINDTSQLLLERARSLTGSEFGFVGYIDPRTGYLISPTLTADIWDDCQVSGKSTVFEEFTGLWGWVLVNRKPLLTNAPAEDPRSTGTPTGHLPIRRFLSAPALIDGRLVGQVALANSDRDYTEQDLAVVERLAVLYALAIQRHRADEELRRRTHELGERVKELGCLYGISHLVEQEGASLEKILQGVADLIPPAWQYPEITCGRVTLEGQQYRTKNFRETVRKQASDIVVAGDQLGAVEVCYLEERPESDEGPFLKEERALLAAIAERLGDITERKRFVAQLEHAASHDSLTNLFSRRRFNEDVEHELARAQRNGSNGALLFLDLDQFKDVNDSLGHPAGDELLIRVSDLLRDALRETDTVGRLGGDEFAALLPNTDLEQASAVAEKLLRTLQEQIVGISGHRLTVTASIGIALFPEPGMTAMELTSRADLAMYQAKKGGRNRFRAFEPDADWQAETQSRLDWRNRIREALDKDQFLLYAQPILDLRRNEVTQYELLLRMSTEEGELLLPADFLGTAERSGSMAALERWVVRQAIHLIAELGRQGPEPCLEVNISAKALVEPDMLPMIQHELSESGIDGSNLILEVTETTAVENITEAQDFVKTLKALGCRFALDDFGTGVSSFYLLKHLPVDYLKIDGAFVRDLPRSVVDQHLVQAMANVAQRLGVKTIAEFVSDEETVRLLRQYGVDYAQGYHIGRPGPVSEVVSGASLGAERAA